MKWFVGLMLCVGGCCGGFEEEAETTTDDNPLNMFLDSVAGTNYNPPDYIRNVTCLREGDGVLMYFSLGDREMRNTRADGTLKLVVGENRTEYDRAQGYVSKMVPLYYSDYQVTTRDFNVQTVGLGAFQREVLIANTGRIAYSEFLRRPTEMTGKCLVSFTLPDGKVLSDSTSVIF